MNSVKSGYWATIILCVMMVALALALPVYAQASKNFYEGKTITFLVGSSAGGGTDLTARVIARHIERYSPGKPLLTLPTNRARAA